MQKIIRTICVLLALTGLLAGCGKTETESTGAAVTNQNTKAANANALYAEVSEITGNRLTIKVLQGSFDPEQMARRMPGRPGGDFTMPEGEGFTMPEGSSMPARGERPQGEPPQDGWPQGGDPMANEAGEPFSMPGGGGRYTGEEKEVVIPSGTPVKIYTMTDGELKEEDAGIGDITSGSTINIVYDDDGGMKEVQIISMGEPGGFPGFPGGMTPPMG